LIVLRHLGWSPQRFDSRSKPLGRIATRLEIIFQTLAHEADHASSDSQKKWARRLLRELGSYERLMLAGLLADLSSEHRAWVRESDVQDPSAEAVLAADGRFRRRLQRLFLQGAIMSEESTESFVGQVVMFLRQKKRLHYGQQVAGFCLRAKLGGARAGGCEAGQRAGDRSSARCCCRAHRRARLPGIPKARSAGGVAGMLWVVLVLLSGRALWASPRRLVSGAFRVSQRFRDVRSNARLLVRSAAAATAGESRGEVRRRRRG